MRDQWARTSSLMALLANINRDTKSRREPFTADDFNPFAVGRAKKDEAIGTVGVGIFKTFL